MNNGYVIVTDGEVKGLGSTWTLSLLHSIYFFANITPPIMKNNRVLRIEIIGGNRYEEDRN